MKNSAQSAMNYHDEDLIEYSVYIHHGNDNVEKPRKWERASKTADQNLALEQAQMLHSSNKYEKVEIKKTFFCKTKKKLIGQTFKIYKKEETAKNTNLTLPGLILAATLGAFFTVATLLGSD